MRRSLKTIDAYLLRLMATPMVAALMITLAALLLERVLRLFELLTGKGAPLGLVVAMTLNLVPHYLGLALPAAFAVGIIVVMTSLTSENEIDAIEGAGWSIRRIAVGFVLCAVALSIFSTILFGWIQPYTRYGFQAVKHELEGAVWNARVEAGVFVDAGDGLTISAEDVDPTGRFLEKVFVRQVEEGGSERILTSARGVLIPNPDRKSLRLRLVNGVAVSIGRAEGELSATFDSVMLERELDLENTIFRKRGIAQEGEYDDSERELTLGELWDKMTGAHGFIPEPRYAAEFYARILRSLAIIGVPLIAIPLAVAGKRSPPWRRVAVALAILVAFQNITKAFQGAAANGDIDPLLGIGGLGLIYFAMGAWLFATTPSQGTDSAARNMFVGLDNLLAQLKSLLPERLRAGSGER